MKAYPIHINSFFTWYDYDNQGRLITEKSSIRNVKTTAITDATFNYYTDNQVLTQQFPSLSSVGSSLVYTYDNRGRATEIKNTVTSGMLDYDRFRENLTYNLNGNVSTQGLTYTNIPGFASLNFSYDYYNNNRLWMVNCSNTNYNQQYTYDRDGSFTWKMEGDTIINFWSYVTGTNKLSSVCKNGVLCSYTYDEKGHLIDDWQNGVYGINYNLHNLPIWYFKSSNRSYYYYDDSGNRIGRNIYNGAIEFQLRDNTGKELAVYNMNTGMMKYYNLFGNGSLGRAEANWDSIWVEDPRSQNPGYWSYSRTDSRYYYIRIILEASE